MDQQVQTDKRLAVLEKRLAVKDKEVRDLRAQLAESSRRLAGLTSIVQSLSTSISRLTRS